MGKKKRFFLSRFELFLAVVWLTLLLLSLLNTPYRTIFIGWALLVIGYSFFYRACISLVKKKKVILIKDFVNHNCTVLAIMLVCLGIGYVLGYNFVEDIGYRLIGYLAIDVVIFAAFVVVYLLLKKSSRGTEAGYIPELRDVSEALKLQRKSSSKDLTLPLIIVFTVFLILPLLLIAKQYINLYTGTYMLFIGLTLLCIYKVRERKLPSYMAAIQWWKHYQIVLGIALVNTGLEFLLIYYEINYVVFDQSEKLLSTVMLLIYLGFDLFLFCAGPIFACYGIILYVLTNDQEFKAKKE